MGSAGTVILVPSREGARSAVAVDGRGNLSAFVKNIQGRIVQTAYAHDVLTLMDHRKQPPDTIHTFLCRDSCLASYLMGFFKAHGWLKLMRWYTDRSERSRRLRL